MSYQNRCRLLNSNPVLVAKHFQYRTFFFDKNYCWWYIRKNKVLCNPRRIPSSWLTTYALFSLGGQRTTFNFKQKVRVCFFCWLNYSCILTWKKIEKPELHELVKLYQLHRHSKTFRKYKNEACRFKFGKFFSKETLVAESARRSSSIESDWICQKK